jgi:hypothetical protein
MLIQRAAHASDKIALASLLNIATSQVNEQMFFLYSRVTSHSIGIPTKIRGLGKGGG